jgi:hypothetical protein
MTREFPLPPQPQKTFESLPFCEKGLKYKEMKIAYWYGGKERTLELKFIVDFSV